MVFGRLKLLCVLIYLDNINVFSRTFNDHLDHLKEVFTRLQANGIKLKPLKFSFFKTQLEFLGHIVLTEGIKPIPAKVKVISKLPLPKDKLGVQVILGMAEYYQRFIHNFAEVFQPLFYLICDNPFKWTQEC